MVVLAPRLGRPGQSLASGQFSTFGSALHNTTALMRVEAAQSVSNHSLQMHLEV